MTALTHAVTGHQITTDDESVEFWTAAGYRVAEEPKSTSKKTTSSRKSSSTKK